MAHQHDWHELGRVFPLSEDDYDVERLSPDGGHVFEKDADGNTVAVLRPASHPKLRGKVPAPTPHVILQCQDPDCPAGPKEIKHVELTEAEWKRLQGAHGRGAFGPNDGLLSTLSLEALGLGRIQKMLGEGRRSGASEVAL